MERVERVRSALAGAAVDRVPISFWWHNFARENSVEELVAETVEQFRRYDWDLIKVQSRATVFAEGWGVRYRASSDAATPPIVTDWPIKSTADLAAIRPLDPCTGPLGDQLNALQKLRAIVGPQVPILQTVFAPAMVLSYMIGEPGHREQRLLELLRKHPFQVHSALRVIRETLSGYAAQAIASGADGIFLAIKAASATQMTRAEYAEFGLPYDRAVLSAAQAGWLNMLHLCGSELYFEIVDDLGASLVNWALERGNPGLKKGRDRSHRAVIGGVSAKPRIRQLSPEQVTAEVAAALEETGGKQVMIGPGCSISPDTPEANLRAVRTAVARYASQSIAH